MIDFSGLDIILKVSLITIPFGLWKLIEILIWLVKHVHISFV